MTQPKYLMRISTKTRINQVDSFTVHYKPISKYSGESVFGIPIYKNTGKLDKCNLFVNSQYGSPFTMKPTKSSLQAHIRKLRDTEAEKLSIIDEQIESLRMERKEILQRAWDRGNCITLKEIKGLIK